MVPGSIRNQFLLCLARHKVIISSSITNKGISEQDNTCDVKPLKVNIRILECQVPSQLTSEDGGKVDPHIPVYEEGSVFPWTVMELVHTKLNNISSKADKTNIGGNKCCAVLAQSLRVYDEYRK